MTKFQVKAYGSSVVSCAFANRRFRCDAGAEKRMGRGKAYCSKCKKMLREVISSFECLSTWDKEERFYNPGDDCGLVKRCPNCGTLVTERDKKIRKKVHIESNHGTKRRRARPI